MKFINQILELGRSAKPRITMVLKTYVFWLAVAGLFSPGLLTWISENFDLFAGIFSVGGAERELIRGAILAAIPIARFLPQKSVDKARAKIGGLLS